VRALVCFLVLVISACESVTGVSSPIQTTPTSESGGSTDQSGIQNSAPASSEPSTTMATQFDWTLYHILQGDQYPQETADWGTSNVTMTRYALFDDSTNYRTAVPSKQGDINKLYGTSDCGAFHMNASARWGWRFNTTSNLIELFAFGEYYGNHIYQHNQVPDATIELNKPIKLSIVVRTTSPAQYPSELFYFGAKRADVTGASINSSGVGVFSSDGSNPFVGSYDFYVNGTKVNTLPRACNDATATPYELIPYFGGTSLAPHEIILHLADEAHAH